MRNWLITSAALAALGMAGAARPARAADTKVDKTQNNVVLRAQDVMGMNVRNAKGESLGDIKDLMVDMRRPARVRYAALDFGGFLGVGDKLFAVPWQAFKVRRDADNDNRAFLELNVDKESLKNAPGFDKDHWPNFADEHWADAVNKHYRVKTDAVDVDVNVEKEKGNADKRIPTDKKVASALLRRASQIEGVEVKNEENKKIGEVEDIVINVDDGKVGYVALSFGGFLGIGDKLFAVPWDAVRLEYDARDKKDCVIFNVSKERLENAPGFDKDHWPNFADKNWSSEIDKHYQQDVEKAASRTKQRRG